MTALNQQTICMSIKARCDGLMTNNHQMQFSSESVDDSQCTDVS